MHEKSTDELKNEIRNTGSLEQFFKCNNTELCEKPVCDYINEIIKERKIKKSDLVKGSGLNRVYAYQILSGKRVPSRDKLIAVSFGLRLNLDETDELLKYAGFSPLYARSKHDAIIIAVINEGRNVFAANEILYENDFDILTSN